MIRIIKIMGWNDAARERRLQVVSSWLEGHGWVLTDYSDEAHSAMFERPENAPRLGVFHPTRWMPAPFSWRPQDLLASIGADPRLLILPALGFAGVVVVVTGLSLAFPGPGADQENVPGSASPPANGAARNGQRERWLVVASVRLNVREDPSLESQVVGVLYKDQRVLVREEVAGGWVRIGLPERGFVSRRFLIEKPVGGE